MSKAFAGYDRWRLRGPDCGPVCIECGWGEGDETGRCGDCRAEAVALERVPCALCGATDRAMDAIDLGADGQAIDACVQCVGEFDGMAEARRSDELAALPWESTYEPAAVA